MSITPMGIVSLGLLVTLAVIGLGFVAFRGETPSNRFWAWFMIMTLFGWVGAFWIAPLGWGYWLLYLLPFLLATLAFGLKIAADGPSEEERQSDEPHAPFPYTQEQWQGPSATREAIVIYARVMAVFIAIWAASYFIVSAFT